MATTNYQNVGTPRFYIDWLQYAKALGIGQNYSEDFPSGLDIVPTSFDTSTASNKAFKAFDFTAPIPKLNYIAMLGHNLGSMPNTSGFQMRLDKDDITNDYVGQPSDYEIINGDFSTNYNAEYDGFSIVKCTEPTTPDGANRIVFRIETGETSETVKVSAISTGSIYDMPHSPDLNLKMSIEMDGVKNIKTKGGVSLTGINYTKPQNWGDMGAWQLSRPEEAISHSHSMEGSIFGGTLNYDHSHDEDTSYIDIDDFFMYEPLLHSHPPSQVLISNLRSGRRVWDLSFSYLSDTDVFPVNATTSNPLNTYPADDTLLDGTDFFSQVWNKTMGGHLPFIFQPDKDNANPDQFAICRFDMKSLQLTQKMHRKYNVKLKIRECW